MQDLHLYLVPWHVGRNAFDGGEGIHAELNRRILAAQTR